MHKKSNIGCQKQHQMEGGRILNINIFISQNENRASPTEEGLMAVQHSNQKSQKQIF